MTNRTITSLNTHGLENDLDSDFKPVTQSKNTCTYRPHAMCPDGPNTRPGVAETSLSTNDQNHDHINHQDDTKPDSPWDNIHECEYDLLTNLEPTSPSSGSQHSTPKTAEKTITPLICSPLEYQPILDQIWPNTNKEAWPAESPYRLIYDAARSHALPNYLGAKITIPSGLNLEVWERNLVDYQDQEVCQYLRYGWPVNYTSIEPPQPTSKNHSNAHAFLDQVDRFIAKEVDLDAMLGPFDLPPFSPWVQTSPIMTREKKNSHDRRIIVDLSFPPGASVNSGIPRHTFQGESREYSLPSIADLITKVQLEGEGCFIWKADLSRAYRQLRIDPLDTPLLAIKHRGYYYLDLCPSFGCRTSGGSCQRTTDAVVYMMAKRGHFTLAYVDDFCGVERGYRDACTSYSTFEQLTSDLGLALAPDKCTYPSTNVEWLGFEIDTKKMTVTIPAEKLAEVVSECEQWLDKKQATKRQVQSLTGKLVHISKCIPPGRKFISRILTALRATPDGHYININRDFRSDVRWFLEYAMSSNGVALIDPPREEILLECDSCLEGGGGHSDKAYFSMPYDDRHKAAFTHITQLEAVNLLITYRTLSPIKCAGSKVVILTDNLSSKYALTTGRTKDPVLGACARELWLEAAKKDHTLEIRHKPGAELILADALSRRHISQKMCALAEDMVAQHGLIEVAPVLKNNIFDLSL